MLKAKLSYPHLCSISNALHFHWNLNRQEYIFNKVEQYLNALFSLFFLKKRINSSLDCPVLFESGRAKAQSRSYLKALISHFRPEAMYCIVFDLSETRNDTFEQRDGPLYPFYLPLKLRASQLEGFPFPRQETRFPSMLRFASRACALPPALSLCFGID